MNKQSPKQKTALLGALLFATAPAFVMIGCDTNDEPLEEVGESMDDAADDVGDAVDDAADSVDDAVDG